MEVHLIDNHQVNPSLLTLGEQVYQRRCLGCHGPQGKGNGPAARFLDPQPRDFTKGIFKFRSTSRRNSLPTDLDLFVTITRGLWGTAMPPWYSLSEQKRLAVIQYIKTFSDRWTQESVKTSITIPAEPPVTKVSLLAGQNLYQQHCVLCHGQEGLGNGPLARKVNDFWGFPIAPANFTLPAGSPGGVKLGHDSVHLYTTIMTGVGGTPMPVFEQQLNPSEVWDLVHFIQSLLVISQETQLRKARFDEDSMSMEEARTKLWSNLLTNTSSD